MNTTEAPLTETSVLQIPRDLAQRIEQAARDGNTDVPSFLERTLRSYKLTELRLRLKAAQEEMDLPQEFQDVIQSWVDEIRTERLHANGH